ncbi:hypothetical protein [Chondromyces apiculatus]|uniref:Uncharacterized protein n=1 Tax=Chondromyces apiculatus DSM 436 TaxID=1192034 RepID=A0A017SV78_9BACT|nr:hypothetical protein [Chondromyces apiculatus]EYF00657.1 Hypothetical protein CAP_0410 [Chondromyces apiculatus DSM 436]
MSPTVSTHLARANKAARLLVEASSQEEAGLLLEAGFAELQAAVAAAPTAVAERVQQVVNDIAGRLLQAVNPGVLAEAVEAARA